MQERNGMSDENPVQRVEVIDGYTILRWAACGVEMGLCGMMGMGGKWHDVHAKVLWVWLYFYRAPRK